jgi:hypothetical protein
LVAALALAAVAAPARAQSNEPNSVPVVPIAPADGALAPDKAIAPRSSILTAPAAPAARPSDVPRAKATRVPLAKRWWFWAGLGTAAVGVVLAAIFLGPRDPYNGNATPGTVFF